MSTVISHWFIGRRFFWYSVKMLISQNLKFLIVFSLALFCSVIVVRLYTAWSLTVIAVFCCVVGGCSLSNTVLFERVIVLEDLGVQIETSYLLRSMEHRFIPLTSIHSLILYEHLNTFSVETFIAVLAHSEATRQQLSRSRDRSVNTETKDLKIIRLFKACNPSLEMQRKLYIKLAKFLPT